MRTLMTFAGLLLCASGWAQMVDPMRPTRPAEVARSDIDGTWRVVTLSYKGEAVPGAAGLEVTFRQGTLDILIEAGWVMPKGRREAPGRPVTWVTTPAFLDHFALASLDDLPRLDELEGASLFTPPRDG